MLEPGERVLVAVSGGKDSLALWDILLELGYEVDGLYLGLGIGEYSGESGEYARAFAADRAVTLRELDLRREHGYDVPTAAKATRRVPCSACGLSKRHLFDSAAPRGRLRRRGHGSQPRRRGGSPARQRAALGCRLSRPSVAGASGRARLPAQDQATRQADRAGDRGVVPDPRHRLPGRGVPDGRRQQAPRLQGGAQLARAGLARHEVVVLSQLHREHGAAARRAAGGGGRCAQRVRTMRCSDDRRDLRLLPARRDGLGARPGARRADRGQTRPPDDRPFDARRTGHPARRQEAALPRDAETGR